MAAARALPLEPVEVCEIGDPDMPAGHRSHHQHVDGNAFVCSCGQIRGVFTVALDERYWSGDPAEVEAARRDHQAYIDSQPRR